MLRIISCCKLFVCDESGATAIEYAMIAGIVSIAVVGGLTSARDELSTTFNNIGNHFKSNLAN